jgi:GntR family histidine utilization transcriptional repressor
MTTKIPSVDLDIPVFQHIKNHILEAIQARVWKEGEAVPSELTLAKQFGVSRMTVNRAMRELTAEQTLIRIQGSGTYVTQQKYQTTLVEIKSISEEIRSRGHQHRSELYHLSKTRATEALRTQFELFNKEFLFHSIIVHFENETPIQVEERWVNPAVASDYMQQDFSKITPNEYLMAVAPLQGGEYIIEAIPAADDVAQMLKMNKGEACLVLRRKTKSMDQVATVVTMWHPAAIYRVMGVF